MDATYTADVLAYNGTVRNEYGNVVDSWATTPNSQLVYGWGPAGVQESTASRDTLTADVELFVPEGFTVGPKDHVRLDGITYEVNGDLEDWNHSPFNPGFSFGGRVNLRRFIAP